MKKTDSTKFSTDASKFRTKAEMINELVALVEDWDRESLIDYAKECRRTDLESASTFEVAESWVTQIGGPK